MANGLTLRPSVETLENSPDALDALRDAYGKMQALTDNRGWIYWAGVHGYSQFLCWHHSRVGSASTLPYNLFLPWHRAYLLYWGKHSPRSELKNGVALVGLDVTRFAHDRYSEIIHTQDSER
jgi:hypothetical protein